MKKKLFVAVILILLFAQSAFAHHLWIEKEGNVFKVLWGHPPEINPYETEKLKLEKAFDRKGKEVALERKDGKDAVYLSSKSDISTIVVSFESGYLVTTPDGKKRFTKREAEKAGLQIIDSVYSSQYAKGLFAWSESITKPSGLKFEIVPLKNPLSVKDGELLPVKVFFDGKPIEGASIETGAHKEATKTGRDGIADVKIMGRGLQVILAKHRLPAKDNPDADYLSYTTVLTFEVQ